MTHRIRAIYTRASPFAWAAGLVLLAVAASAFPVAAVAWLGAAALGLMSLGAAGRGLWALGHPHERAVEPPASALGRLLAAAVVPLLGGWLASMACFAPCPVALRWVGGGLFGAVAFTGLVLCVLAPKAVARPVIAHLHDPLGLTAPHL